MIYLLRHGETGDNARGRFIGQSDVPLSANGIRQAVIWRDAFSTVHLERIYTSDLSRCTRTAHIIAGTAAPVVCLRTLREINLGSFETLSREQFRKQNPDLWLERGRDIFSFKHPGGESFRDLQNRVLPVFDEIATTAKGDRLIITHAGVIRSILAHIRSLPADKFLSIQLDFGGLNLIEYRDDRYRILGVNLTRMPPSGSGRVP